MNSTKKSRSMILFENYVHSEKTRELYTGLLNNFCKFHQIPSWDTILQFDKNELREKIEDYLLFKKNNGSSLSHLRNISFSIQSYLDSNDFVPLNWKKIRKLLGKIKKPKNTRPYTTQEIQLMLSVCRSLRNRALILFFSSSGVRRGAIPNMKMKDLKQMPQGCLSVTVYAGDREEYTTFINQESSQALTDYFELRKKRGELLKPNSLVFPNDNYRTENHALTETSISLLIRRLKESAGIGGTDDSNLLVHAFRRRFNTILKLKDNANITLIERLMGHSNTVTLDNHYFQPTKGQLFEEYQKGMADLTIDNSARLQQEREIMKQELSELEEEQERNRELSKRMKEYEDNQKEILKVMNLIQNGQARLKNSSDGEIHVSLNPTL